MNLSYHNDPAVKARHVKLAQRHADADRLIAGAYWNNKTRKGCSVGCLAKSYRLHVTDHAALAEKAGLPEWLVHVQDKAFEGLASDERAGWHVALAQAIPVGVDLEPVKWRWLVWVLTDPTHGVLRHTTVESAQHKAVVDVAALCERAARDDAPSREQWAAAGAGAAAAGAEAAATWATWAAARAAARATWATWAAGAAAAAGAEAAATWATWATWAAWWKAATDELLRLLEEAS